MIYDNSRFLLNIFMRKFSFLHFNTKISLRDEWMGRDCANGWTLKEDISPIADDDFNSFEPFWL
jgi:hypothetical protein